MSQSASAKVTIVNRLGLHARPATMFAEIAGRWPCDIQVRRVDQDDGVNGKSVLQLMLLAGTPGTELEITADGDKAREAVDSLVDLVKSKFEEE
ncbi:MAG: HPr family phosphocarrier protein [Planctomycetota bacterium]